MVTHHKRNDVKVTKFTFDIKSPAKEGWSAKIRVIFPKWLLQFLERSEWLAPISTHGKRGSLQISEEKGSLSVTGFWFTSCFAFHLIFNSMCFTYVHLYKTQQAFKIFSLFTHKSLLVPCDKMVLCAFQCTGLWWINRYFWCQKLSTYSPCDSENLE